MQPLIGITPSPLVEAMPHGTFPKWALNAAYAEAVGAAGGVPLILPPHGGEIGRTLDALDGLLLSGGADIDPARYGDAEVHPATYGIDATRDAFELVLVEEALRRDLPTLAICRGIQVLNVALGGTLIQDVPDQRGHRVGHRQHEAGIEADQVGHPVRVVPGSLTAELFGPGNLGVNSFHHQAIRELAPALVVGATAEDGIVEAVELPTRSFVLGVQWHPELMFERHGEHLAPFRALVAAAAARTLSPAGA